MTGIILIYLMIDPDRKTTTSTCDRFFGQGSLRNLGICLIESPLSSTLLVCVNVCCQFRVEFTVSTCKSSRVRTLLPSGAHWIMQRTNNQERPDWQPQTESRLLLLAGGLISQSSTSFKHEFYYGATDTSAQSLPKSESPYYSFSAS